VQVLFSMEAIISSDQNRNEMNAKSSQSLGRRRENTDNEKMGKSIPEIQIQLAMSWLIAS
jgi:hypothetical protein